MKMAESKLLQNESVGHKLIKKGFRLYLFAYIIAPAGYLVRVIISNSISVEEVGVIYSIIGFVSLISVYNDLGLTESLQYFLPKYWIEKKYNNTKTILVLSLGVQMFTALLLIVLLWYSAPRLAEHYFHFELASSVLRIFCIYFLGKNAYEVISTIFASFQDTFNQKLIEFIRMRSIVIFVAALFVMGQGSLLMYTWAWVISSLIALIVAIIIFYSQYREVITRGVITFDKQMIHEYKNYAFWVFIGVNAANLLTSIDQQMIIVMLGANTAAYYSNYTSLINMSGVLIGPILGLIFPLVTELMTKKDIIKIEYLQNFLYTYLTILSLSLSGFLIVLGPEIATVLFGQKFVFSGILLRFGAVSIALVILLSLSLSILTGLGKIKERVKIIAAVGLLNVIMNLVFVYIRGVYGIIISTIIGLIIMLYTCTLLIHKHQKITMQRKYIRKNTIIIILLSLCIYFIKHDLFILQDAHRIPNMIWLVILGGSYYLLFLIYNRKKVLLLRKEILDMKKNI